MQNTFLFFSYRNAFPNEQCVADVKEAMKWILGPYLSHAAGLHFKLDVCSKDTHTLEPIDVTHTTPHNTGTI